MPTVTYTPVVSTNGKFQRSESIFRRWIRANPVDSSDFPAAAGRYHLFVAYACPWANRALALLYMKGLEKCISISVVHPTFIPTRPGEAHVGWHFKSPGDPPLTNTEGHGSIPCDEFLTGGPDPVSGATFVRDLYEESAKSLNLDAATFARSYFSVPILWCKHLRQIVNNESSEIIRMLNSEFNEYASNSSLDLYPLSLRSSIEECNEWIYHGINNGVYTCGFSTTQEAYDAAVVSLFECLDKCESILSKQRYIAGPALTESDIRLFVTLVRFDEVYVVYFKTNCRCIREYPNIMNYCREIYQIPGVRKSVNMDHIKKHYFTSHSKLNLLAIVPKGPDTLKLLREPHNRNRFENNI
ncbi:putative Glutathionyl-hydroquinone reductase YqjG [Cardiosporidium cionae]|uniref:Glutathionyl-hydroquinone reductase YqjG n=1 Tax=Cardiosporidium cionae TaxID=476202 RepID=A0ABQ7JA95_9APIC|nr:putative Glutathionyl-hydroquinone reductase YqjG [Cardiosporidium cionae]|eukprot:KAF8820912.1 putative Glutathionyl-hydroquinone reductase YqjG [Cardiosporidium cionae]